MIEIVVMAQSQSYFVERAVESLKRLQPPFTNFRVAIQVGGISREQQILNSTSEWILFLDEDCYLPSENIISRIEKFLLHDAKFDIYGGLYLSEQNASYQARAYNELCNAWVYGSKRNEEVSNLLGGCLALRVSAIKQLLAQNPIRWGGEETFLLRHLQKQNVRCGFLHDLSVFHAPRRQNFQTIRDRALVQGFNRKRFALATPRWSFKNLLGTLRFAYFWPFWAMHFFFVGCGSIFQVEKINFSFSNSQLNFVIEKEDASAISLGDGVDRA